MPIVYPLPEKRNIRQRQITLAATEWASDPEYVGNDYALARVVAGPNGESLDVTQYRLGGRRHRNLITGDHLALVQCGWNKASASCEILVVEGSFQTMRNVDSLPIAVLTVTQREHCYNTSVVENYPLGYVPRQWREAVIGGFGMMLCSDMECLDHCRWSSCA